MGFQLLKFIVRHILACRPDYKTLGVLKQQFPDVPILALTATATRRVCQDLTEILRISACETFHTSVDRPNLYYSVRCVICQVISMAHMPGLPAICHRDHAFPEAGLIGMKLHDNSPAGKPASQE